MTFTLGAAKSSPRNQFDGNGKKAGLIVNTVAATDSSAALAFTGVIAAATTIAANAIDVIKRLTGATPCGHIYHRGRQNLWGDW
ncbi:hypothetical protein [Mycobacterium sp. TY814]|uniref:hypothetical protein n=1 Tax=Mycobacterium sp. TY814 TaxID=3050580 RepID=UPI002740C216|nr:hypothetical protein [Mycobacterium sp. TY814]MDP7725927.1 hypothetical protein [Mycobacterium sp. TY814]